MSIAPDANGWIFNEASGTYGLYRAGVEIVRVNATGFAMLTGMTHTIAGTVTDSAATTKTGTLDLSGATVTLGATMGKGHIPLPLNGFRFIAANDIPTMALTEGTPNTGNIGGVLGLNTDPTFKRVNGATDKNLRIAWAATSVVPITQGFVYPADLDDTAPVIVNLLMAKDTNTDTTATVGVAYFEGVSDTNAGGNTAAFSAATLAVKTVTIAAADIGTSPASAVIEITPGTHGNDAFYLYGAWLTYTKKTA